MSVENGKKQYKYCIACHGVNGEGDKKMKAPRLQGQLGFYIQNSLTKF